LQSSIKLNIGTSINMNKTGLAESIHNLMKAYVVIAQQHNVNKLTIQFKRKSASKARLHRPNRRNSMFHD